MTPTTAEVLEALDVALSCLEMSDVDLEHYQRNPALAGLLRAHRDRLEREQAFVEAAKEWGINSIKWDSATEPHALRILHNEAQAICVRMDHAYRALAETEEG